MAELGWDAELLAQAMLYMHGQLDLSPEEQALMDKTFDLLETAIEPIFEAPMSPATVQ